MQPLHLKAALFVMLACFCCRSAIAQRNLTSEQYLADFDFMWSELGNQYAYFDTKQSDWNNVREIYRPTVSTMTTRSEFVNLLERVLDELYDHHASLNTNLSTSPRLVPTGLDVWAEWKTGRAVITQLRRGFSAEQSGLKVGMEIVSINGVPIEAAIARRIPRSVKKIDDCVRNWALRAVLAGTHDRSRTMIAKNQRGSAAVYHLDLPSHTTVDKYRYINKVDWRMLPRQIGYIKITDLIAGEIVPQFDAALSNLRSSRGLILDLRDIPRGGNTDVAEPILGRFINRKMGYQRVVPVKNPAYVKEVSPRGQWTYTAPMVVLVNRWTGSMAEGMAIGLDGMSRATVVGTQMAGLNGGIFNIELPNSKIGVNFAGEKLKHINGTPRELFVPPVFVNLVATRSKQTKDPILETGYERVVKLAHR